MKLLITTQKVDRNDDILGFFHQWIIAFAKKYEQVTVICLEEGEHDLPGNVVVHSLGKEHTPFFKRLTYITNFYRYIAQERANYDAVLVHMNPEYMVLGGFLWRLWGKKTALWYNHKQGGILARLGAFLAHHIFYTSPYAFMARFKKARQMPAGIDTDQKASSGVVRKPRSILSLGRISPVKQVEVMIDALKKIDEDGVAFTAIFYGDPTDRDRLYFQNIKQQARSLEKKGLVTFHPALPNRETPDIFAAHSIFINATPSGSLDKTILEAAYHGALPVVCNDSFRNFLPNDSFFKEGDSTDLADTLRQTLSLEVAVCEKIRHDLRLKVVSEHSLVKLINEVATVLRSS